ncbi:hypothetical protein EV697_10819 [Bisgaardia hudsonensis]|uniref:Uncharacterized protein n=1 Tax=Bisgaardia hudsonensis TaxID=109472 RepID=A0A4R2MU75_9PAST|nr:hypothetical protein [Bisgaardia hudsonensis]QLB12882.1 hypothetical protein A6A11_04295 [Bisgaardia hudsonensis]TCP11296.1 hypothetical protein EV697_10819 [Bisgaardia hudsonensis]
MKPLLLLSLILVLSGCYLANGSPPEYSFWKKNGIELSDIDAENCYQRAKYSSLNEEEKERFDFLEKIAVNSLAKMAFYHESEYKEYLNFLNKLDVLKNQCLYDLGYRFQAPLYWCLAQDGDNTQTCIENMKYRK